MTTAPGDMAATMSDVTSTGEARPGMAAVVMTTSAPATCGARRACWYSVSSSATARA